VAALAADAGGFDPPSWGWSAALLLLVAAGALLVGARRLSALEWALPGSLAGLTAWAWLSLVWSEDIAQTVQEGERMLPTWRGRACCCCSGAGRAWKGS
jgi:hypothetical protein